MKKKVSIAILCIGIMLLLVGIFYQVPGDKLTTYRSLDGKSGYSSITEYVGGDAYNYIIGASLIAGKISGIIAMKSIFIAAGCLISCMGLVSYAYSKKEADVTESSSELESFNISENSEDKTSLEEQTIS